MSRALVWLLSLLLLPLAACAQAPSTGKPVEGLDYEVLPAGQRWKPAAPGRIEVAEVFAYTCSHCADFQPAVDTWKKTKPADVDFVYVPAAFDPESPFARAYFAAETAGILAKVHQPLFDAVHERGSLPHNATIDELGTWFTRQGHNGARLTTLMRAADMEPRLKRAHAFAVANRVNGTPTLIVNGKYLVRGRRAEDRLRIVDALVAMERAATPRPAPKKR
jgi:thiol:disulfide interchange protein DsbA